MRRVHVLDWLIAVSGLIALAVGAGSAGAASLEGTLKTIKERGTIVIGFRETAPPFSFRDADGPPAGYSVDMCRRVVPAVARAGGVASLKVKFVPVTVENRIDAVATGRADIECGSTTNSLSRQERVDFTNMTFVDGGSLLVVDGLGIRRVADLAGKRVAVIPGTTTAPALTSALAEGPTAATVVHVKTHAEGLALLEAGEADAYASDRTILIGLGRQAKQPERYALTDVMLSYEPYGFMVRRNDAAFRLVVNRVISRLYRTGEIAEIYKKWLGDMGEPSVALRVMYRLFNLPE
jgi:glutamate/aspartate transport system substrate-binding protein